DNENKVVTRKELMAKIGEQEGTTTTSYIDVCVKRLKDKLERELGHPILIVQEDGASYKFTG
ncbi:MAG: helix-turn-helix domain-containing protein, partial [Chloroflexota bacterium]